MQTQTEISLIQTAQTEKLFLQLFDSNVESNTDFSDSAYCVVNLGL